MNRNRWILPVVTGTLTLVLGLMIGRVISGGGPSKDGQAHDPAASHPMAPSIWTCSMHPQIQQAEPGDCPLCGMELIPLVTGNSTDPAILTMTEAAIAMARVETMTVGGGSMNMGANAGAINGNAAMFSLTGRLAPDEPTASRFR